MSCKGLFAFVALIAIAAAAVQEPRHPPNHHHDHGHDDHSLQDHSDHVPVPPHLLNPEEAPLKVPPKESLPVLEEIVEEDKIQAEDGQKDVAQIEETVDEDVNEDAKKILEIRQEETEDDEDTVTVDDLKNAALWVDCDYSVTPRVSCHDCKTRVLCKYPGGGKVVPCYNPMKPYCYNGYCSAVPSSDCS